MVSVASNVKGRLTDFIQMLNDRINDPIAQRRLILLIVCTALLLDNMLYMVIVPIIPMYLEDVLDWGNDDDTVVQAPFNATWNSTYNLTIPPPASKPDSSSYTEYAEGGGAVGVLFASKAIVQLMVNPFTGALIDRIGYDVPLMIGLIIMFFSTIIFAFGETYAVLFFARSLQGMGSAFADTSGLAMIADRYREDAERTKALGIAQSFISFGCLVAPPFGGTLFEFAGKVVPFIFLATMCLVDGILLLFVMKPVRLERSLIPKEERPQGTPIYRLLMDPYILVAAGALAMSNISLAFLEPTIAMWMKGTMNADEWQIGFVWLPPFLPYIGGVVLTVYLARKYPSYQWLVSLTGLIIEGVCCFFIPFSSAFFVVLFPLMGLCLGVALVDTAILPTLAYLVDVRHSSVYGSVYAIADISYSLAYALGPIMAGQIVQTIGFMWLNVAIMLSNLMYAPVLFFLRRVYEYKPFTDECDILVADPPPKDYSTYMQNGGLPNGKIKEVNNLNGENHLRVGKQSENTYIGNAEIDYFEPKDAETYSFYGPR
ncbi:vesicular acetylcholine transporter-like [Mizuhopecten yessoensis]|uniref:Vesicular acetylcholine transporter n=1 Tax=Mizuhopecten yessoensis TaxID=6573 RepID=A0A210QW53_MIZYE|nr:vesicular acetylcholine transporter-like [Mizuhopecten yessoensis]XP_021348023.1 vesicular acetylcholine transporter-like [Mizuhopecten yessoensis]OWF52987.1 Vesicular acetylcholine transporter [Mizuhopecten yessoensis]